mmetsp:Transcript_41460/g.89923  ORF Transcript_41460/g.89923 Transcript_41460/m.89923 type:complete len:278 (+) Transcript_41460:784-1617(+)
MASSKNTTCPSVTAFDSSKKSSGTPEPMSSSASSANCRCTFSTARARTPSSNSMSIKFRSFASNSRRDNIEVSFNLAKARSVKEPPPRSSLIRPARCRKQPKKVRLLPEAAFLRATYFQSSMPKSCVRPLISFLRLVSAISVRCSAEETSARRFQTLKSCSRSNNSNASSPASRAASARAQAPFSARTASPGRASMPPEITVRRSTTSDSPRRDLISAASTAEGAAVKIFTLFFFWALITWAMYSYSCFCDSPLGSCKSMDCPRPMGTKASKPMTPE